MYRISSDLRFVKNRDALRRAYIDLVKEKGTAGITVKELAERANVNRMTFYSHYDTVTDILHEYVDDMTRIIMDSQVEDENVSIARLFEVATDQMRKEIDFFRLVAKEDGFELFRERFRSAFRRIFEENLRRSSGLNGTSLELAADMIASGVTHAYLDWLAGAYGDMGLEDLVAHFEAMMARVIAPPPVDFLRR